MFVNRRQELAFLLGALKRKSAELLVLYGRRRMGKTALLQEVALASPVPALYHVAAQTTRTDELARLSARMAVFFKDDVVRAQSFRSWEALLGYMAQQAARKPFVFLWDEFPYAVEGDRSLPSILQAAWDHELSRTGIKLVLCGSSIGMMERACLSPEAPLFGRRTGQWKVDPFGPIDFALLWPFKSMVDLLSAYCVTGGCPLYATRMNPGAKLETNIRDHILTKGSMLYDEVPFLLREELRDPHVYQSVMGAVAAGARKFSEISSKTGLDRAHLTRYLSILIGLDMIERDVPVTEVHPEKSRKGIYRICDPFMAFWYRFVFPMRDRLEGGEADTVLREEVLPALDAHISRIVEPVIRSLFMDRWKDRVPFKVAFAGRHWSDREEFDCVLMDSGRRNAMVVEIKWAARPVSGRRLLVELERKIAGCDFLRNYRVTTALVSRSGFSDIPDAENRSLWINLREEQIKA